MTPAAYVLIFFLTTASNATASVKVGFTSDETCAAAARELTAKLKALNIGNDVVWSCVRQ
jgi:hypothetical protein